MGCSLLHKWGIWHMLWSLGIGLVYLVLTYQPMRVSSTFVVDMLISSLSKFCIRMPSKCSMPPSCSRSTVRPPKSKSISSRDFCLVSWKKKKMTGREMQRSKQSVNNRHHPTVEVNTYSMPQTRNRISIESDPMRQGIFDSKLWLQPSSQCRLQKRCLCPEFALA